MSNNITIPAKSLYEISNLLFGLKDADDYDYDDMMELLFTHNVMEKIYPTAAEIEKGQQKYNWIDSFWDEMEEGEFYYYLGTLPEMIARLERRK